MDQSFNNVFHIKIKLRKNALNVCSAIYDSSGSVYNKHSLLKGTKSQYCRKKEEEKSAFFFCKEVFRTLMCVTGGERELEQYSIYISTQPEAPLTVTLTLRQVRFLVIF
jgi:hypothetical protein